MSDHEGTGQEAALAANEEGEAVLVVQEPAGGAPAVLDLAREGNRVRLLVVAAVGQETGLIDFALTLADGTAMQQRFGLEIVQAIERNLGQTPRGNPNLVPLENLSEDLFEDDPFEEWLEELLANNNPVAGFFNWNENDDDEGAGWGEDEEPHAGWGEDDDEDEGLDAGWGEDDDDEDEVAAEPEVPIGGGPDPGMEPLPRASRRPAKEEPKEHPGFGGNYRDRSRSPIDDEGGRD